MRPGQNRRVRGRNRSKGPNPLTRSYESNGPDVKIRGTAQHVADKYAQLARDAQASGDPVAAENYFQHAEHYYRLIAAVQEQYRQQYGAQRPFDDEADDGDDESPGAGQPFGNQPFDRGQQAGDDFGEPGYQPQQFDRRPEGDRQYRPDRSERFARNDRQDRGERHDRGDNRQDRGERNDRRFPRPDRPQRHEPHRPEGSRFEGPRDQQSNPDLNRRRDRDAPEAGREEAAGLPAFLTTPVRPPIAVDEPGAAPAGYQPDYPDATPDAANGADLNGARYGLRPRRRRRPRFEGGTGPEGAGFSPEGADTPSGE